MTKRVTILDVAQAAGVSRQTVTRAVNDMGDISEATRRHVLDVGARLGYRPSRFARNLVERQKAHALGFVVGSFRNPYFTDIAGDMLAAAAAREWQVVMSSGETGDPRAALDLLSRRVDVVIGHFALPEDELCDAARGMPVIQLELPTTQPGVHSVEIDLRSGIHDALAALRARGSRRFGMVDSGFSTRGGAPYVPSPRRRWFEEAAAADLAGVAVGDESIAGGAHAFTRLRAEHPDVDAVLVFNDLMALGAVQAAPGTGVRVPQDVRILGIDGLSLGETVSPRLSTLSIDRRALVAHALDIADELAAADFARADPIHRVTRPRLLWRESA